MQERLGIELTPELEADILERIQSNQAIVERQGPGENVTTYRMTLGAQVARVVFSHRSRKILTVMQSHLLTFNPKRPPK